MGQYDDILGPLVLSAFVNTYFCGIIGYQMVVYRITNFNDNWIIKALVGILFFVDLYQEIVAIYMIWIFCVSNYLNPPAIETVEMWTYTVIPACNAISGLIVHLFLSHKMITSAKKRNFYGLFVGVISVVSAVFAIASSATSRFRLDKLRSGSPDRTLVIVWLSAQVLADLMITANLSAPIYSKSSEAAPNGKPESETRLSRTTSNIVQTGTVGTLFSGCTFLLFLAAPQTRIYIMFLLPLGRLYTICLMGVLLSREAVNTRTVPDSLFVTDEIWVSPSRNPERNQSFNLVRVTTERQVVLESDLGSSYHSKSDRRRFSNRSDMQNSMSDDLPRVHPDSGADVKATSTM